MDLSKLSIVEYFGGDDGHKCGYCKSSSGFVAPGMWGHKLTVQDLQYLTDRGWRRSGKYCYKPKNDEMCCPLYIIRCDTPNFTMKKSQKKVLNKLKLYLLTGRGDPRKHKVETESKAVSNQVSMSLEEGPSKKIPKVVKKGAGPDPAKPLCRKAKELRREKKMLRESVDMSVMETGQSGLESNTGTGPESSTGTGQTSSESSTGTSQTSSDSSTGTCQTSSESSGQTSSESSTGTGQTSSESSTGTGQTSSESSTGTGQTSSESSTGTGQTSSKSSTGTGQTSSNSSTGTGQTSSESSTGTGQTSSNSSIGTGQTSSESNIGTSQISPIPGGNSSIAGPSLAVPSAVPPYMQVQENGRKPLEDFLQFPTPEQNPAHILEIRLVRSHPPSPEFLASLRDSYNLHKKYQINIHKDLPSKCTMESFTRFLVDSPLIPEPGPPEWKIGYGSYHQQYYLDGRLIMVGVVDILPNCLSSKYLYYDTDFEFMSLGVVSALNEIALIRKLHMHNPDFRYYCMGYYVHSCQKMKYKGGYTPSFLLCPETYNYVPIEQCRPKLDIQKYSRLSDESEVVESDKNPVESYLDSTLVLYKHEVMQYESFCALFGKQDDKVKEYARLVGPMVAKRCLLFIS